MHTNAAIDFEAGGRIANLTQNGKVVIVTLQSPPDAVFRVLDAVRLPTDPGLPDGGTDDANTATRVLAVDMPPGTHTVAVMFSPLWTEDQVAKLPSIVPLDQWTLESHLALSGV